VSGDDKLAPARGLVAALVLAVVFWAIVVLLAWKTAGG